MVGKNIFKVIIEKGFKVLNWNPFQFVNYDKKNIVGLAEAHRLSNGALDKGNNGFDALNVAFSSHGLIKRLEILIDSYGLRNG